MRHRAQSSEQSSETGTDLAGDVDTLVGKHRAPVQPQIPAQTRPTHDTDVELAAEVEGPLAAAVVIPAPAPAPVAAPVAAPASVVRPALEVDPAAIPVTARWRASHLPRIIAGTVLALAVLGTSALGVRYAQSRTSDDFVSLVVGLVVVVVLWALVIASTPQTVTLEHSVLTVHNTGGSERFDLVDPLQPVDLVGDPRTSHWAVLLHRPNSTTVVLRRNDVVASELDPIVRHYRTVADQRWSDRQARFNR